MKTALGINIDAEVAGNTLTLTIDLSKTFGRSKSGKSETIATTAGNATLKDSAGNPFKLGLNVYK